tara:strand:- start:324 stop:752 length:429 start_codon:yes stop_codon:yes gene_type:complete
MPGLVANRVVVPFDYSDLSMEAVARGFDIVGDGGTVYIVHILADLPAMEYGNLYGTVTDESRIECSEKSLREKLSDPRFSAAIFHITVGDPGSEITKFAESEKVDMIVMSSHGYGFVKHVLLGSVAERVVRLSHCPVLVLRK